MKSKLIYLILLLLISIAPLTTQAQPLFGQGVSNQCIKNGNCTLCDFLAVFVNIARFILVSMGGVALILILWAAIGYILNFGSPEKINANKRILLHTILGVIIVLLGWQLVQAIIFILVTPSQKQEEASGQVTKVLGRVWWRPNCNNR